MQIARKRENVKRRERNASRADVKWPPRRGDSLKRAKNTSQRFGIWPRVGPKDLLEGR